MEEEMNYVTVTFKSNVTSTLEKPNSMEIIYDEVKTKNWDTHPVIKESRKKALLSTSLTLVVVVLGMTCLILVSSIIVLILHFKYELRRQNSTLTEQNLQLQTEKRKTEDLTRERNQLNWTVGVILEYEHFPVKEYCQLKVCKPCPDGWLLFQSSCFLFIKSEFYAHWKNWEGSQKDCKEKTADLVVIDSQEEQEFISNHTDKYGDNKHGYWIGLIKDTGDPWKWVSGTNLSKTYWSTQEPGYQTSCALSNPHKDPLANWDKAGCSMKNCWICERRSLIPSQ